MTTHGEMIGVEHGNGTMGAYVARPSGTEKLPGVLLLMEVFGVNEHIRSVADRIAAAGYVVLAPDLFHRTAPGIELQYDEAGLGKGIELMSQVQAGELISDLRAAMDALSARPDVDGGRIGVMGFCFGGHAAYLAACELPVQAAVSFYGGGVAGDPLPGTTESTLARTGKIQGQILCLFGENDDYIPLEQVEAVRGALEAAGVIHEVVVYPGTGHGFFCDVRDSYDTDAAADAWNRVKRIFGDALGA